MKGCFFKKKIHLKVKEETKEQVQGSKRVRGWVHDSVACLTYMRHPGLQFPALPKKE